MFLDKNLNFCQDFLPNFDFFCKFVKKYKLQFIYVLMSFLFVSSYVSICILLKFVVTLFEKSLGHSNEGSTTSFRTFICRKSSRKQYKLTEIIDRKYNSPSPFAPAVVRDKDALIMSLGHWLKVSNYRQKHVTRIAEF